MNKKDVILELVDVNKKFEDSYAVENFNLYVKKGELLLFLDHQVVGKRQHLE